MPNDYKLLSKNTSKLIESALNELADTQSKLAEKQLKSVLKICFDKTQEKDSDSIVYKPKMIDVVIERNVIRPSDNPNDLPTNDSVPSLIKVPLITMVPISLLGVKNVNISLNSFPQNSDEVQFAPEFNIDDEYSIDMKCDEQPIPKGLQVLIEVLTNTINPIPLKQDL